MTYPLGTSDPRFALLLLMLVAAPALDVDLEGHRSMRGLAPENTLAAFRRALEIGVTTIETDMAVTKDDVVVISHNPSLNPDLVRDTDGHWLASPGPPIRTLTLAELRRLEHARSGDVCLAGHRGRARGRHERSRDGAIVRLAH